MICSRCAVTVPDNSVSCPNCGLVFQNIQTIFCSTCGTRLRADAAFCSSCGQVLQSPGQPPMPGVMTSGTAYTTTESSSKAIASMILGILSLFCSIIAGIPAIILGHLSLSQVKKSGGRISGEGMAMTGLILGYVSVAVAPLLLMIAIPNLMRSRAYANQAAAASNVRTLIGAETSYSVTYLENGYAPDLATLGPGGQTCQVATHLNACLIDGTLGCVSGTSGRWCVRDQYKFSLVGVKAKDDKVPTDFIITATPVDTRSGRTSYCATADGVVRFRSGQVFTPINTVSQCTEWIPL